MNDAKSQPREAVVVSLCAGERIMSACRRSQVVIITHRWPPALPQTVTSHSISPAIPMRNTHNGLPCSDSALPDSPTTYPVVNELETRHHRVGLNPNSEVPFPKQKDGRDSGGIFEEQ